MTEMSAPWSLVLPEGNLAHFHIIERGGGWLSLKGDKASIPLASGDLLVVPHGRGHTLADNPKTKSITLGQLREKASVAGHVLRYGGGGTETHMICGSFQFDNPSENPLLTLLPPIIHIRGYQVRAESAWIDPTVKLLIQEARHARPGSGAVITRLTDILFVQAVRAFIEELPPGSGGWLGALRDRQIGTALALIHREPEREWSVSELAEAVGSSRSPFAAKFTRTVGEPPLSYLSRWRMYMASNLVKGEKFNLSEIAARVGYISEAAFSRAFKRHFGVSPRNYRRRLLTDAHDQIAA